MPGHHDFDSGSLPSLDFMTPPGGRSPDLGHGSRNPFEMEGILRDAYEEGRELLREPSYDQERMNRARSEPRMEPGQSDPYHPSPRSRSTGPNRGRNEPSEFLHSEGGSSAEYPPPYGREGQPRGAKNHASRGTQTQGSARDCGQPWDRHGQMWRSDTYTETGGFSEEDTFSEDGMPDPRSGGHGHYPYDAYHGGARGRPNMNDPYIDRHYGHDPRYCDPRGGYDPRHGDPRGGYDPRYGDPRGGYDPRYGDPRGGYDPRHGDPRGGYDPRHGDPRGGYSSHEYPGGSYGMSSQYGMGYPYGGGNPQPKRGQHRGW